jgi:hypothetical protein
LEKVAFANLCEQPEPFKLVFHGIFKFSEAQLDTSLLQGLIQLSDTIGRRDIHAGDRLSGDNQLEHFPVA